MNGIKRRYTSLKTQSNYWRWQNALSKIAVAPRRNFTLDCTHYLLWIGLLLLAADLTGDTATIAPKRLDERIHRHTGLSGEEIRSALHDLALIDIADVEYRRDGSTIDKIHIFLPGSNHAPVMKPGLAQEEED